MFQGMPSGAAEAVTLFGLSRLLPSLLQSTSGPPSPSGRRCRRSQTELFPRHEDSQRQTSRRYNPSQFYFLDAPSVTRHRGVFWSGARHASKAGGAGPRPRSDRNCTLASSMRLTARQMSRPQNLLSRHEWPAYPSPCGRSSRSCEKSNAKD